MMCNFNTVQFSVLSYVACHFLSYLPKLALSQYCENNVLTSIKCIVLVLTFKSVDHLKMKFVHVLRNGLNIFSIWISHCPIFLYWNYYPFLITLWWLSSHKVSVHIWVFCAIFSISLILYVFVPVLPCLNYFNNMRS